MSSNKQILPGATLGVMGGGQLGRMFTQAAHRLGYRVHVLTDEDGSPAAQLANQAFVTDYDNLDCVEEFARSVDVITFEFENVPTQSAEIAATHSLVRPGVEVLSLAQNRMREKSLLQASGFPVTPFRPVSSKVELDQAMMQFNSPAVLKSASWGYDGKGQVKLDGKNFDQAWERMDGQEFILEKWIDFECEISVIGVRGPNGEFDHFGPIKNEHRNHILDVSLCPTTIPESIHEQAVEITNGIMTKFNVVGVLCVEFFVAPGPQLLINEIAPRPHNSGHLTIDACVTSQFEQQVRSICGLPLGSCRQHSPAAMANLLGDLWKSGEPAWTQAMGYPDVKTHLYGKSEARQRRKMGHLVAFGKSTEDARRCVISARDHLASAPDSSPNVMAHCQSGGTALETISDQTISSSEMRTI